MGVRVVCVRSRVRRVRPTRMWQVPDVYVRLGLVALLWMCFAHLQTRDKRWQAMEAVEAWYAEAELGGAVAFEALGAAIQALKHNL